MPSRRDGPRGEGGAGFWWDLQARSQAVLLVTGMGREQQGRRQPPLGLLTPVRL